MQEKHKVTLYLPPELHRQLKIRSAVDIEPMSAIAKRAIDFYLSHPALVDEMEAAHGHVHQVYSCPACATSLVLRDNEIVVLSRQPEGFVDEELSVGSVAGREAEQGEQELLSCV